MTHRAALQALAAGTRPLLLARAGDLEEAVTALIEGRLDEQQRQRAERSAHQLTGSAGTIGFGRASDLARELEAFFARGASAAAEDLLPAVERLEALRQELEAPVVAADGLPDQAGGTESDRPTLLIAHPDAELAQRIARAAQARGWRCHWAADAPAADRALRERTASVVLLDPAVSGGDGLAVLARASADQPGIPVLVLTDEVPFLDRVLAGRAGAHGFVSALQPPVRIVEAAAEAMSRDENRRVRLLAVDDDPVVLAALAELFGSTGMRLSTLQDPLGFWDALEQTAPDLLVLDLDMPEVNGLELCRLVRGDPRWATLPVLVLTASTDARIVQQVFAAGADDYVSKPFVGPELLTRVSNRLDRVRLHRQLAETDGLTGLANRRTFEADFARLCALAKRHRQPLSFALLDLDAFKQVNDRYGHAVGDAVLQRLTAVIAGSFRGEDLVARWGGEEIAVAMLGMRGSDGVARVASVLEACREVSVSTPTGSSLHVSFSAGVAEHGVDGEDLHELYRAADAVLYEAKRCGGDRVLPAGWRPRDDDSVTDVLLVEDDELLAGLLVHALATRGLASVHLTDGKQALRRLVGPNRLRARVVLLDVDLPGLDGLALLRELDRHEVLARTKVIMLTARSSEPEVLAALRQGAVDHVAKPLSVPVLLQRIRHALED